MTETLTLTLPWPPSLNHYWRHNQGRTHISAKGKAYRKDVSDLYAIQGADIRRAGGFGKQRLRVSIDVAEPDRRRRDIDNLLKSVLDALEAVDVFDDDCQVDELRIKRVGLEPGGALYVLICPADQVSRRTA